MGAVETEGSCCHDKRPRRSLVTDINVWTECFATMAATFLAKALHFFAYLRTIMKVSRTFESSVWASYDMAFRRQAANRGSLDWGLVNAALYNEAFAGHAKQIPGVATAWLTLTLRRSVCTLRRNPKPAPSWRRATLSAWAALQVRQAEPGWVSISADSTNSPGEFQVLLFTVPLCPSVHEVQTPTPTS